MSRTHCPTGLLVSPHTLVSRRDENHGAVLYNMRAGQQGRGILYDHQADRRDALHHVWLHWDDRKVGDMLTSDFREFANPNYGPWSPIVHHRAFTSYMPSGPTMSRFEFVNHLSAALPMETPNFDACIRAMHMNIHDRQVSRFNLKNMKTSKLIDIIRKMFKRADINRNGVLEIEEFRQLLRHSPRLGLTPAVVEHIVAEADTNGDGVIDYDEFLPKMLSLLHKADNSGLPEVIGIPDIWNMDTGRLIEEFRIIFSFGCNEGNTFMYPDEFEEILRRTNFNFSEETIKKCVAVADVNHDGMIDFDEFVPAMLRLLRETFEDQHQIHDQRA